MDKVRSNNLQTWNISHGTYKYSTCTAYVVCVSFHCQPPLLQICISISLLYLSLSISPPPLCLSLSASVCFSPAAPLSLSIHRFTLQKLFTLTAYIKQIQHQHQQFLTKIATRMHLTMGLLDASFICHISTMFGHLVFNNLLKQYFMKMFIAYSMCLIEVPPHTRCHCKQNSLPQIWYSCGCLHWRWHCIREWQFCRYCWILKQHFHNV